MSLPDGTHKKTEAISREGSNGESVVLDFATEDSSQNEADVVCSTSVDGALFAVGDAKIMPDFSTQGAIASEITWSRLESVPYIRFTLQTQLEGPGLANQGPLITNSDLASQDSGHTNKILDAASGTASNTVFPRTVSVASTDSRAEYCRICQQPTDEPLIELGCHCRGELSKTHRSCIQQWFNNKGSNKCEVCGHVATNLPAPVSQPLHNFWAWRMSRSEGRGPFQRWQRRGRFHPLLAALLILVAGLLFDILISYYLGASALPVNIIIGVLVALGLGTAGRLIIECYRDRNVQMRIRQLEMATDMDHVQIENGTSQ